MLFLFGKGNGMPEDLLDTSLDITRKKPFYRNFEKVFFLVISSDVSRRSSGIPLP